MTEVYLTELWLGIVSELCRCPALRTGTWHRLGVPNATTIFVVISAGGGVLWRFRGVRTRFSAMRNAREPGEWAGLPAGLGAVVGLTGSSLLAGLGGVALTAYENVANPTADGVGLTVTALAAVLIGGVSIFGRRAGVAGVPADRERGPGYLVLRSDRWLDRVRARREQDPGKYYRRDESIAGPWPC